MQRLERSEMYEAKPCRPLFTNVRGKGAPVAALPYGLEILQSVPLVSAENIIVQSGVLKAQSQDCPDRRIGPGCSFGCFNHVVSLVQMLEPRQFNNPGADPAVS